MADNGKIIRNGAEIQIDENGGIIARPADGQELIVEDDAVVGALEADQVSIGEVVGQVEYVGDNYEVPSDTVAKLQWDTVNREDDAIVDVDLSNDEIEVLESGDYRYVLNFRVNGSNDWSTGDEIRPIIRVDGSSRQVLYQGATKVGDDSQLFNIVGELLDIDAGETVSFNIDQRSGETQEITSVADTAQNIVTLRRVS